LPIPEQLIWLNLLEGLWLLAAGCNTYIQEKIKNGNKEQLEIPKYWIRIETNLLTDKKYPFGLGA